MAGSHAAYRPDIDGLRAVSILAVVLFHAFPRVLGSGYVGVDVFFVISGYLIGGLITAELAAGTFRFSTFYARRVRRLFPALILVLAFVVFVGWHMMFSDEFRLLGRHVMAAALFISNFPLMGEIGYFGPDVRGKPLLHLWSLGIEEQFYLVWPILSVLTRQSRRTFLFVTLAVAVVSLALSVTSAEPGLAFYQPWTRFWELAVGVMVAHLPADLSARWRAQGGVRALACALGLALILGVVVLPDLKGFPGWWAVVPVAGAALVIASGPDTFLSRWFLASRPMVFIGKISYPLYLWHWPLLAFAWIGCGAFPPTGLILILVAASFVLAWLTYVLVERPARFGASSTRVVRICVPLMIALGTFGVVTMMLDGMPGRRVDLENRALAENLRLPRATRLSDGSCETAYGITTDDSYTCQVRSSQSGGQPVMLIMGDSIAMAFNSAISAGLASAPAVLVATTSPNWVETGCLTDDPLEAWSAGGLHCQKVIGAVLSILDKTPSIKAVVVPTFSDNPFFDNPARLRRLQEAVTRRGRKLVLVAAPPAFYHEPAGCWPRQVEIAGVDLTAPRDIDSCQESRANIEQTLKRQHDVFAQMARDTPGVVTLFESVPVFCDATLCYQSDDRGPLFWSWGHVNERGSSRLLGSFLPWLQQTVLDK